MGSTELSESGISRFNEYGLDRGQTFGQDREVSGSDQEVAARPIRSARWRPDSGDVAFPGGRPEIGFVFQEPTLMPWATVAKNARLPLVLKGVSRGDAEAGSLAALKRWTQGKRWTQESSASANGHVARTRDRDSRNGPQN